ncbi:hypothetical protein EYZ11_012239 [Aspergillus tanneri]|uniref:Uncharacterized protein n=1 Tax=Aspergillus tanneri TaxID=1220188 RepID=A0A4S3J108_9EURO|nr:uncharacterized protein ATNIH1004_005628 [Aspergillus tanneri]KAA8646949.1 hypothetical protein ATNIH1004_005628 [Aspergillus tanneri]THC88315.1 hypothetical protein EYZ11_012239 [Aspergillus tanneri]
MASKTSFDTTSTYTASSTATLKGKEGSKKWFSKKATVDCERPKSPASKAAERALHSEAVAKYFSMR